MICLAVAITLLFSATTAFAAPSCTDWLKQTDGSYFRTCVGDDGKQYCETTVDKKTVSLTSCQ